jgi:hypothetical protein
LLYTPVFGLLVVAVSLMQNSCGLGGQPPLLNLLLYNYLLQNIGGATSPALAAGPGLLSATPTAAVPLARNVGASPIVTSTIKTQVGVVATISRFLLVHLPTTVPLITYYWTVSLILDY